jgi:tetratricopeptide (TPR) repeat protein
MSDIDKIIKNINNKNLHKALELCKLYENNNNVHIIHNLKGVIYHLQNNLEMAEICFLKSFKLNKNFLDPLKNLYIIYNKLKKIEEMINIGKKLIEKNQLDPSFNYKLAFAYDLKKNFSKALKFYKKCIEIKGKERNFALNNIGSIYLKLNKPKISLDYFLEALNLGQNDKIVINNILFNYLKLKDKKNSELFYFKAEKIDENYIEFQFNKAEYLLLNNQINEAIKILEKNKHKYYR